MDALVLSVHNTGPKPEARDNDCSNAMIAPTASDANLPLQPISDGQVPNWQANQLQDIRESEENSCAPTMSSDDARGGLAGRPLKSKIRFTSKPWSRNNRKHKVNCANS